MGFFVFVHLVVSLLLALDSVSETVEVGLFDEFQGYDLVGS